MSFRCFVTILGAFLFDVCSFFGSHVVGIHIRQGFQPNLPEFSRSRIRHDLSFAKLVDTFVSAMTGGKFAVVLDVDILMLLIH